MSMEEQAPLLGPPKPTSGGEIVSTSTDAALVHVLAHDSGGAEALAGAESKGNSGDAPVKPIGPPLTRETSYGALADEEVGEGGGASLSDPKRKAPGGVPCRTVAGVVCFFVIVALMAVGVYVYDKVFVTPPPDWLPIYHAGRLLPCPFNHSGYLLPAGSVLPPTPYVTRNNTWSADLCWYRRPNASRVATFELQVDDWWTNHTDEFHTVYRGPDSWGSISNLLPDSDYHYRVRNISAHNVSTGFSDVGTIHTFPRGSCGNRQDMEQFRLHQSTMKHDIQTCLLKCVFASNKKQCTSGCIKQKVGLSIPCADCWYEEGECTLHECFWDCGDPNSTKCKDCSEEKCFPACVKCAGVERWAFPS